MAAQTWTSLQNAIVAALEQAPSPYNVLPPDFETLFPQATSYAENRIYREIPMLTERKQVSAASTVPPGATSIAAPQDSDQLSPLTIESFGIVVAGVTYWYDAASAEFLESFWTDATKRVDPQGAEWIGRYWAPFSDAINPPGPNAQQINIATILFAPPVSTAGYTATFVGLYPPLPISATNPWTYLSTVFPELLQAGCMVFLSGYLEQNFSAQGDVPEMAVSHEAQFQKLLDAAKDEERRRRGLAPNVPMPRMAAPAMAGR